MNIGIFGTKAEALYLARQLEQNSSIFLKCFIDNNSNLWGSVLERKQVISFAQMVERYEKDIDKIIIAIRGTHSRLSIIQQLKNAGIKKVGLFKYSAHDYQKPVEVDKDGNSKYIVWLDKLDKPVLPYLETNVVDGCNLKCKGCTHFSNLFEELNKADIRQFEKDLIQIEKKCHIVQLRLLGGEPLLNNELYKFIEVSRDILPHTDIEVVTNGLLIPKQDFKLFEIMRKKGVGFLISKYRPTMQMRTVIVNILQENEVDYYFERENIDEFGRTLSMEGNSNTELSQKVCISRGCRFLRNGFLYKCPFEGLIDVFALKYGYEDVLKEERGFNIYDNGINWEEKLDDYLTMPVAMCKYCAEKCEKFKWETTKEPKKEDWLVEDLK